MSTTTSQPDPYGGQSTADVNAILQGMTDARIDQIQARRAQQRGQQQAALPPQVQPGYQPPMPTALQPTPQQSRAPWTPPYPLPNQPSPMPGQRPDQYWLGSPVWNQPQQPPQQPQQFAGLDTNLIRDPTGRNNPGNIRIPGARGPAGFQQFPTMQAGIQAMQNNLLAYQDRYGLNTIAGIVSRWTPPNENNTELAIQQAEKVMQIDRNQRIDLHDPATMQRMTNAILYNEQHGTRGGQGNLNEVRDQYQIAQAGPGGMNLPQPQQNFIPATPRDFGQWGRQAPGFGMNQPGMMPQRNQFGQIMGNLAPLLVGIASLALRMPLSTAITAYGAMERARQNGQNQDYERNRTKWQDQLKEATAQQALESHDAADAFSEYGNNNPAGLQQTLAQIAMRYNDPVMFQMAERGDLNGIYRMQQRRDTYNQDLTKLHKAAEDEADRQAQDAAVDAMDHQWHDDFVAKNGREPTADETAIAHNEHIGEAGRAGAANKTGGGSQTQGPTYKVIDKDGKPTGQLVVRNKSGIGWVDPSTGQPVILKPGETPEPLAARPGKIAPANPYVQPDQQQDGDVTAQPDQSQPDQSDTQQQGAAQPAAQPSGATAQQPAPAAQADAGALPSAPYQVAQAGPDVPPPPTQATRPSQAAPAMGPAMSRLNEDGRRLARDYATNGNEALQDVPAAFRMPLINAGQELRGEMQDAAQSGLTGDALDKRLHQIDPTYADYLRGVSTYNNDLPTPGRTGSSAGRIMALSIAGKLNPNFSEQKLKAQENFRQPTGAVQRTLSRAAIMAESGRQVREYLKALPADPGLQRWQRAWDQFVNNKLVGDHRYSDLFVALRQYIQEANVLVRGGQESVTETGEQLGTREGGGLFGGAAFAMPGNATPGMILGLLKTDARNVMARMDNFRNQWRQQDGYGEMPGDDAGAYATFKDFSRMDVDKEAGVANDSDIEQFLKQ